MAITQHSYPVLICASSLVIINTLLITILCLKNSRKRKKLEFGIQEFQEKVNIISLDNRCEEKNKDALLENIKRYSSLREIIERIDQRNDAESVADDLTAFVFSAVGRNKGVCILYRLDNLTYKLYIFKTKKEDKQLTIKEKEGDMFDKWVLKQASPLFIEDTRKDFRFDLEKIGQNHSRPLSSLISSPLASDRRLLGILRLDNPAAGFYSQDDLRFLVTVCDLGAVALESSELFAKTQELAVRDELTSLYTRRYFAERLKESCAKSIRQKHPLSLLMLDIDNFKIYNDKFGHTSGDIVLKSLSKGIGDFLTDTESLICRFGGEEFCIILPNLDKKKAGEVAEGIRSAVERTKITLRQKESALTVSVGAASFPEDASSADELMLMADRALYEAKQKGRNRVCII